MRRSLMSFAETFKATKQPVAKASQTPTLILLKKHSVSDDGTTLYQILTSKGVPGIIINPEMPS